MLVDQIHVMIRILIVQMIFVEIIPIQQKSDVLNFVAYVMIHHQKVAVVYQQQNSQHHIKKVYHRKVESLDQQQLLKKAMIIHLGIEKKKLFIIYE